MGQSPGNHRIRSNPGALFVFMDQIVSLPKFSGNFPMKIQNFRLKWNSIPSQPKIIVIRQIKDAGMHNTSLLGKGIISGQQQTTAPFLTFILSLSSTLKCLASSPLGVEDFLNSTG